MKGLRQKFEKDEIVGLDKDLATSSEVKVVSQSSGRLYTTVTASDYRWSVMTYRLSKLNPEKEEDIKT